MSSSPLEHVPLAYQVEITDDELLVWLVDGRRIAVPLVWFPRLLHAAPEARQNWRLIGNGVGIHWPGVDEDLSVEGLIRGVPSVEYARAAQRGA
jgi:hypothetical protein